MPVSAVPVLTYHGYNISGNDYRSNDHIALAEDLDFLLSTGWTIVTLGEMVSGLLDDSQFALPEKSVCITFDDGTDLDWVDVAFGHLGRQPSFYNILRQTGRAHPNCRAPHATSFVIASPEARSVMSAAALQYDHGMSESWWGAADKSRWLSIGNHSWDHRHPSLISSDEGGGHFFSVDTPGEAERQIVDSARYIAEKTARWPDMFAYPWGQASDYLRYEFFPGGGHDHGCRAAFGTEPEHVHAGSDRWFLPRYVCGQHWQSPSDLLAILT
jgi:peptidoglycan/xylan/chitin deacetylase (PgdA/CDA1 family)